MFCNQCEQSFRGTGCVNTPGVCGKDEDVQSLQEMLLYGVKGMARTPTTPVVSARPTRWWTSSSSARSSPR